ncbi:MAG: DNA mismatch repair protein MutS, partial [Clostridia bacterium]|nr:DNA mismatch repair protein MutS [Clostridia bacterium]
MSRLTPMMQQYWEVKRQHEDCILFYRLGDFYEMFFDDAQLASKELELTLTGRDCGQEERAPMCGVPYHSAEGYIARLIARGYKVAICEQTEDPAQAKGLVRREVIRTVTPGTVMESSMLDEGRNNYICSVFLDSRGAGLCFCDISTGEVSAAQLPGGDVRTVVNELARFDPREALLSDAAYSNGEIAEFFRARSGCHVERGGEWRFVYQTSCDTMRKQFTLNCFEDEALAATPHMVSAVGALFSYLHETQKNDLSHLNRLEQYTSEQF